LGVTAEIGHVSFGGFCALGAVIADWREACMAAGGVVTGLVYEFPFSLAPARAAPILVMGFDLVVVWKQH